MKTKQKSKNSINSTKRKRVMKRTNTKFVRKNVPSKQIKSKLKRRKILKKKRKSLSQRAKAKSNTIPLTKVSSKRKTDAHKTEWIFGGWKKIQIRVSQKGNKYLDIRQWYPDNAGSPIGLMPNSSTKGLKPGRYGMCLLPFQFEKLRDGLPNIVKQMKKRRTGNAVNCGSTWNGPTIMVHVYKHDDEMVADLKEWFWDKKTGKLQPGGLKVGLREVKLKQRDVEGLIDVIPEVEEALKIVPQEDIPKNTGGPSTKRLAFNKRHSKSSK